jgi:hypothetical protein
VTDSRVVLFLPLVGWQLSHKSFPASDIFGVFDDEKSGRRKPDEEKHSDAVSISRVIEPGAQLLGIPAGHGRGFVKDVHGGLEKLPEVLSILKFECRAKNVPKWSQNYK